MIRIDSAHDPGVKAALLRAATNVQQLEFELLLNQDPQNAAQKILGFKPIEFGSSYSHVVHVAALSGRLAAEFIENESSVAEIQIAAMLHDIGKVAVPVEILEKPSSLTEPERDIVKGHVRFGKEILSHGQSNALKLAAQVAYSHHERWDGTGYPDRISATSIPFEARIVAIADVYDAITSDRPYHRALSHHEAIQQMTEPMATYFDPALLTLFCQLFPDSDAVDETTNLFQSQLSIGQPAFTLKDEYP